MDSALSIFGAALDKYTHNLLARIALDYNLDESELVAKYSGGVVKVKKPKVPKPDRQPCPGLTGKKTPCKNACLPGENTCHFHSGKPKVPKVEPPMICTPCDLQKLQAAAEDVRVEMSLQERLRMIVGEEDLDT